MFRLLAAAGTQVLYLRHGHVTVMGLQCSILGHAFEDAGVEREREEQGSEVVTTEREIERCRRCGNERVVSESTEVAAVVDAAAVGLDEEEERDGEGADETGGGSDSGGIAAAVERSGVDDGDESEPMGADGRDDGSDTPAADDHAEEPPDPAEEDAEILTDDDEPERKPGEWPDDDVPELRSESESDPVDAGESETEPLAPDEESLSGITVPEGKIVCPECRFETVADSGYRAGDPCPECNAWLEAERNQ